MIRVYVARPGIIANSVAYFFLLNFLMCSAVRSPVVLDDPQIDPDLPSDDTPLRSWGDLYLETRQMRGRLMWCWSFLCIALLLHLCWRTLQPIEVALGKVSTLSWYLMALASVLSHVPGLLGFAGVACLVLESAMCKTKPSDAFWSADIWLLWTTVAFSLTALVTSSVFLIIDYLRRLAIKRARLHDMLLQHGDTKFHRTGLGGLVILLGILMQFFLVWALIKEVMLSEEGNPFRDKDIKSITTSLWEILSRCLPVFVYVLDVQALCSTPKVKYKESCDEAMHPLGLVKFLQNGSSGDDEAEVEANHSAVSFDKLMRLCAGEDFALFAKSPSLQLLFPGQPLIRVGHVLAFVLSIWACPVIVGLYLGRNYMVEPQIIDLTPWYGAQMRPYLYDASVSNYIFLASGAKIGLQLKPKFAQVTRWELHCEDNPKPRERHDVPHWLVKEPNKMIFIKVPETKIQMRCRLDLHGHAADKLTRLDLTIHNLAELNISNCSDSQCMCMDGYAGKFAWNGATVEGSCLPATCELENSNKRHGRDCKCKDGYSGNVLWHADTPLGECTPAPCSISNSNEKAGFACKCPYGFYGKIKWQEAKASGSCTPVPCRVNNSNGVEGPHCSCKEGFSGVLQPLWIEDQAAWEYGVVDDLQLTWSETQKEMVYAVDLKGGRERLECPPAKCNIYGSNHEKGLNCRCRDGYKGDIVWKGATPEVRVEGIAKDSCEPAACNIENSNEKAGPGCACLDGFNGSIGWNGTFEFGSCEPSTCTIPGSNRENGTWCECMEGFNGKITWEGANASGSCKPAPCEIENSNMLLGPECGCDDGFSGEVVPVWIDSLDGWEYAVLDRATWTEGHRCPPAPCNVPGSNEVPGWGCNCADGYRGSIDWTGNVPRVLVDGIFKGACQAVPCNVKNSNRKNGTACQCLDGFQGEIEWDKSKVHVWDRDHNLLSESCEPAPCEVKNSNKLGGLSCKCLDGYRGEINWNGAVALVKDNGTELTQCEPATCNIVNSNRKPGPECECGDAFSGNITWSGAVAYGSCSPAPCNVTLSNRMNGTACECWWGGRITWKGGAASGPCEEPTDQE